jgi:hypothetical protein
MIMADWISGFRTWRARRKRFADEWNFHREMAARELQCFGLTYREARRHASRRLGSRVAHRREALRQIGGDSRGLLSLLPIVRVRRSPWLAPWILALFTSLALGLDPLRTQVLESMRGVLPFADDVIVLRLLPLTPPGIVPTGIARLTVWLLLLLGLARLVSLGATLRHWRSLAYGTGVLVGLGIVSGVCWTAGLGILLCARWGADFAQGAALIVFLFGHLTLSYAAFSWWWRDLESRCPRCLSLLGMARGRGRAQNILLDPLEIESVCLRGHGQARENRWGRDFECDPSTYL